MQANDWHEHLSKAEVPNDQLERVMGSFEAAWLATHVAGQRHVLARLRLSALGAADQTLREDACKQVQH